jgi:hypothetical protein
VINRSERLRQLLQSAIETSLGLGETALAEQLLVISQQTRDLADHTGVESTFKQTSQAPGEAGDLLDLLVRAQALSEEIAPTLTPAITQAYVIAQARWLK